MHLIDTLILVAGILILLGVASSKLSAGVGVPVLVVLLTLGMLAESEGIGGIEFENYELAYSIGTLSPLPHPVRWRPENAVKLRRVNVETVHVAGDGRRADYDRDHGSGGFLCNEFVAARRLVAWQHRWINRRCSGVFDPAYRWSFATQTARLDPGN